MNKILATLNNILIQPPQWKDTGVLIVFVILITVNPYYLNNQINTYELGLYLPGINAIEHGMVPYKDFFHLRGPLELYVPAWLMGMFGNHLGVLCAYFFVGNVMCLVLVVLVARELIHSRFMFYMMIPVIIARTFPRVCFMNWGGMRYALGLMAMYCFIRFLKNHRMGWMTGAALSTAAATLTSVEMGIFPAMAIMFSLGIAFLGRFIQSKIVFKALVCFIGWGFLGVLPWLIYSGQQQAFVPYLDSIWNMATRFQTVVNLHLIDVFPSNFPEALAAMINPSSVNFKQLTPAYTYVFLLGFLAIRLYQRRWTSFETGLLALGIFGFLMYNTAFRAILASQFEMALMPEKIIYFFLIEAFILWIWGKNYQTNSINRLVIAVCLAALFISSTAYAFARYNNRFWSAQYVRHVFSGKDAKNYKLTNPKIPYEQLTIERAQGIWVPSTQAQEINLLNDFVLKNSQKDDIFVMYPEGGIYNFLFDRPFLGRFPFCTLAWIKEDWFNEYFRNFKDLKAKFVIVQKEYSQVWDKVTLGYPPSKIKHEEMLKVVEQSYAQVAETPGARIYQRI